jgi:DNA-directed RNA polymerase specialized sigma24 family protein
MELSALYGLVVRMPSKLRTPLLLRHVEDAPLDEIARRTGVSQTTVKRRLSKAQTLLDTTRAQQDRIQPTRALRQL